MAQHSAKVFTRKRLAPLVVALCAGCAPEFTPASELRNLRVLAVQKDQPYARPGETVTLRMLLSATQTPVQVLWIAGCENPLGDLYAGCFAGIGEGREAPAIQVAEGFEFSFSLSPDIISRRPPPADPRQPPYGLAYVFFAACSGEVEFLEPGRSEGFPIACRRDGKRLGPADFVAGYTSVFAYDDFTNKNPIISGFELEGRRIAVECVDEECVARDKKEFGGLEDAGVDSDGGPSDDGGATEDGGSEDGDGAPLARIAVCPQKGECPEYDIKLVVDPSSAEIDTVARARRGEELFEQMWINYYLDGGSVDPGVKLLSDAELGFNEDHGTKLKPPRTPGPFRVWAVAHDNRGGASWARVRIEAL